MDNFWELALYLKLRNISKEYPYLSATYVRFLLLLRDYLICSVLDYKFYTPFVSQLKSYQM